MKSAKFVTPLGTMIAIADEKALYLLEFIDCKDLEWEIERLSHATQSKIFSGTTRPIQLIKNELNLYFKGKLTEFKTPTVSIGSPFQKIVWEELKKISHGQTRSYAEVAKSIKRPTAYRAVANANGANPLAIIIPCHRVINQNGDFGGYAGGLMRKKWLINHEVLRTSVSGA